MALPKLPLVWGAMGHHWTMPKWVEIWSKQSNISKAHAQVCQPMQVLHYSTTKALVLLHFLESEQLALGQRLMPTNQGSWNHYWSRSMQIKVIHAIRVKCLSIVKLWICTISLWWVADHYVYETKLKYGPAPTATSLRHNGQLLDKVCQNWRNIPWFLDWA